MDKYQWNSIEWATRNHPRRLYFRATEDSGAPTDGRQNVQVVKGRLVNPQKSMSTGGTVVRGRSRKGKFAHKNFGSMNSKSDARLDPKPLRFAQPDPVLVAPRHEGTPTKTAKHVPMRCR